MKVKNREKTRFGVLPGTIHTDKRTGLCPYSFSWLDSFMDWGRSPSAKVSGTWQYRHGSVHVCFYFIRKSALCSQHLVSLCGFRP